MPEIGMPGAGREDQVIVGHLALADVYRPRCDVDRLHFRQNHLRVLALAQDPPDGRGDVRGRKAPPSRPGRAAAERDDDSSGRSPSPARLLDEQLLRRLQPAEAGADDDDMRFASRARFPWRNFLVKNWKRELCSDGTMQKRLSRAPGCAIFRALCQSRLRAARPGKPFRNGSRSPGREKSCRNMPPAVICFPRRAPNASAIWRSPPRSITTDTARIKMNMPFA